jgi:hypothetical protein
LVKGIDLSSPTGTNDKRQKAPVLVSSERTGTRGFSSKTKKHHGSAYTGSHTRSQPAPPPPLLITIAKNTNKKFNSISIPSQSSSHNNHHNDKSFNFTTSINITN